jgi:hypothetical protein
MDRHARRAAALLLVTTAAIHIDLVPEHLREAPYAGVLFALLAASALLLAGQILIREQSNAWTVTGTISLAAIAGYALSRSVGLPSMDDDTGDWLNPLGVVAVCAETLTVLISLERGRVRRAGSSTAPRTPLGGASHSTGHAAASHGSRPPIRPRRRARHGTRR